MFPSLYFLKDKEPSLYLSGNSHFKTIHYVYDYFFSYIESFVALSKKPTGSPPETTSLEFRNILLNDKSSIKLDYMISYPGYLNNPTGLYPMTYLYKDVYVIVSNRSTSSHVI